MMLSTPAITAFQAFNVINIPPIMIFVFGFYIDSMFFLVKHLNMTISSATGVQIVDKDILAEISAISSSCNAKISFFLFF